MPPDVALLLPTLFRGGSERMMINLAGGLSQLGVNVELVALNGGGPLRQSCPSGVPLVDLGAGRVRHGLRPLMRYLDSRRPRVLIPTITEVGLLCLLAMAIQDADSAVFIRVGNTVFARPNATPFDHAMGLAAKRLFPRAAGLVCVSRGVAESCLENMRIGEEQIHVIPNPVVTPQLKCLAEAPVTHVWFHPAAKTRVVLAVGRLHPMKDFSTLILAFSQLPHRHNARLLILGEGPERGRLELLIRELGLADRIEMPGWVDNPYAYMARAAVYVLSSRTEGSPSSLVEALACRCPVVATDCRSGPSEILDGGKLGRLVSVGCPDELARAIDAVLSSAKTADGASIVSKRYSLMASSERYAALIRSRC